MGTAQTHYQGNEGYRTIYALDILGEAAESCTIEGESPVIKKKSKSNCILSSMGHEESRVNQRGPPRKAKYSCVTDSEQVP